MHTPRLCIDGRWDKRSDSALVVEEVINQLVASQGEPDITNEWIDKGRTVLLAHPNQIFEGQWRRYNTKMPVGISPLYWTWERNFVQSASLSVFHKFRAADRIGLGLPCTTITTVLSPGAVPRLLQWSSKRQIFIVPSRKDRTFLVEKRGIAIENIRVIHPTIRRYCFFTDPPEQRSDGQILILHDGKSRYRKAIQSILRERFQSLPIHMVNVKDTLAFEPSEWLNTLKQTLLAFYLVETPFDWAIAALETIFRKIPLVFQDEHGPLSELLPGRLLRLSAFLVDQPSLEKVRNLTCQAFDELKTGGVFEPLSYARQFKSIYDSLPNSPA